jgi:hypothetical protein|tara:strand:+ start:302 stop:742 length:441 start_codon:yes stop_codon:yes gene_type:complete
MSFRCLPLTIVLSALLCSCAGESNEPSPLELAESDDPPGTAQALSLVGQADIDPAKTPYDRAIDCAIALTITEQTLIPLTEGGENSPEVRALRTIGDEFRARAQSLESDASISLDESIRLGVAQRGQDRAGQARLAIACANSLQGT